MGKKINFADLKSAFKKVEQVCTKYLDFDLETENGDILNIRLRGLTPTEDTEILKKNSHILENGSESTVTIQEFRNNLQLGILSHAIIKINDLDLEDVTEVMTGESTKEGTPIWKTKSRAVEEIIKTFPLAIIASMHAKYVELITQIEKQANKAFKYTPPDINFEIDRLEKRLTELKEMKSHQEEEKKKGGPIAASGSIDQKAKKIEEMNKVNIGEMEKEAIQNVISKETKEKLREYADAKRDPIIIDSDEPSSIISPDQYEEEMQRLDEERKRIEEENRRIMELREKARRQKQEPATGARPPHISATKTNESKDVPETINGIPVYRMKPYNMDGKK